MKYCTIQRDVLALLFFFFYLFIFFIEVTKSGENKMVINLGFAQIISNFCFCFTNLRNIYNCIKNHQIIIGGQSLAPLT